MPTYASPRISVQEFDVSLVVPAVGATTGAISGVFTWGPMNTLTLIGSQTQLAASFGPPTNLNPETWFCTASFLAYGAPSWVVRVANTTTTNTQIGALSALANVAMVSNVIFQSVLNQADYYANKENLFDSNMRYV